jgi:hypothetical protein
MYLGRAPWQQEYKVEEILHLGDRKERKKRRERKGPVTRYPPRNHP